MRATSLFVLLIAGCLVAGVWGTGDSPRAISSFSLRTFGNVLRTNVAAMSCSNTSARSWGGVARSYSQAHSAAIIKAASTCADAIADIAQEVGSECSTTGVEVFVSLAAKACARAAIELRVETVVNVSTKGRAIALSNACAHSSGQSEVTARAIARTLSDVFAANGKGCSAFTSANASNYVRARAEALTKGLAGSYANAATTRPVGRNAAQARGSALFLGDVGVYAEAISDMLVFGCSNCAGKGACPKWCNELKERPDAETKSDAVSVAVKGRYALASAFSEAVTNACQGTVTARAAANATLENWVNVCVQITAEANGWAEASGNAVACTNSFGNGSTWAFAEGYGRVLIDAAALAFTNDDCVFEAIVSEYEAKVRGQLRYEDIVGATARACATAKNGKVTYEAISSQFTPTPKRQRFSDAITKAIEAVLGECQCAGAGYCCNCPERSVDCPY